MTPALSKVIKILPYKKCFRKETVLLEVGLKFFQILGLFPCTVDTSASISFLPSRLCVVYHIALVVTISYCNFYVGIPAIVQAKSESNGLTFEEVLELFLLGMATAVSLLIWIVYPLTRKRLMIFGRKVVIADAVARKLGGNYRMESSRNKLVIFAMIYAILFGLLIFTEYIIYDDPMSRFVWFCFYTVPSFTIILLLIQYSLAVHLTSRRIKALNDTILGSLETTAVQGPPAALQSHIDDVVRRVFDTWKKAHNELYEASLVIAKFYSFPILFVMGYTCYTVIFNSFHAVKELVRGNGQTVAIAILNDCVWILILSMPTVILMLEIENLLAEAKEKAAVCRKLALRFQKHRLFRTQVKMYSFELLHENINFTAFGFFSLNGTVLHSIFATTVTYLVIIFQFNNVYEE
ncbi:putative gustatory receptor 28b [Diachasma alloeum]|uniref:Gustatory receptor n=1 Tax=Diachasma alloeum TaxID=454923 RepID=A0A4E0S181_9HYME|nr:putative gustatory receptor 28b [Diachasma alloeum]THK33150.1 gustatory receptor 19 [Diachasma alloeum]